MAKSTRPAEGQGAKPADDTNEQSMQQQPGATAQGSGAGKPDDEIEENEKLKVYIPTDEDIEKMKANFDTLPEEQKAKIRAVLGIELPTKAQQPASLNKTVEEAYNELSDQESHEALTQRYGAGFVKAEKPAARNGDNSLKTVFTAEAWKRLGNPQQDGSKDGWKPVVKTPPEVKQLKNKKP